MSELNCLNNLKNHPAAFIAHTRTPPPLHPLFPSIVWTCFYTVRGCTPCQPISVKARARFESMRGRVYVSVFTNAAAAVVVVVVVVVEA